MMTDFKGFGRGAGALAVVSLTVAGCQTSRPRVVERTPLIVAASPCADFTQTIYFEADSAAITQPAERLLALAAARSRGCAVNGVAIVGLADAPGDTTSNLTLSQHRADNVKAALHRQGFDKVEIQTMAAGDTGAKTQAGQAKPVRRRADVTFHLAPPAPK